jgi:hypothetical protein
LQEDLLVATTWAGILGLRVHANVFYWSGIVAVSVWLLVMAARAHVVLRRAADPG